MADVTQDEREQRGLVLLRQGLEAFREGHLPIGTLIADLEGVMHSLEGTSPEWRARLIEEWSVLEDAYEKALDHQRPLPGPEDHAIARALDALDGLVQERWPQHP